MCREKLPACKDARAVRDKDKERRTFTSRIQRIMEFFDLILFSGAILDTARVVLAPVDLFIGSIMMPAAHLWRQTEYSR
jgi:hypothetical protein